MTDLVTNLHHRTSHTEKKIEELESEILNLKTKLSQMALHNAELEAALLRLNDQVSPNKEWSYYDLIKNH